MPWTVCSNLRLTEQPLEYKVVFQSIFLSRRGHRLYGENIVFLVYTFGVSMSHFLWIVLPLGELPRTSQDAASLRPWQTVILCIPLQHLCCDDFLIFGKEGCESQDETLCGRISPIKFTRKWITFRTVHSEENCFFITHLVEFQGSIFGLVQVQLVWFSVAQRSHLCTWIPHPPPLNAPASSGFCWIQWSPFTELML